MGPALRYAILLLLAHRFLIVNSVSTSTIRSAIAAAFAKVDLVPQVFETAPKSLLNVYYVTRAVNPGATFEITEILNKPSVFWETETNELYTLAMVDVVTLAEDSTMQSLQWLVANIPEDAIDFGNTLMPYKVSEGTFLQQKYVFAVYQQSKPLYFQGALMSPQSFKLAKFSENYNLGEAIAGNFFELLVMIGEQVNYGSNRVHLGNILKVTDVAFIPSVSWNAIADQWYTLAMVDPDVPSRALPISREFRHWLVINIPGDNVADGKVLSSYLSPTPPAGSGLHRYTFLVYHQPDKISFDGLNLGLRTNFSISKFAKQYNLGKLIDGNFFQAEIVHTITQLIE